METNSDKIYVVCMTEDELQDFNPTQRGRLASINENSLLLTQESGAGSFSYNSYVDHTVSCAAIPEESNENSQQNRLESARKVTQRHGVLKRFSNSVHLLGSCTVNSVAASLIEKPSDDRYNSAWLAGWNVVNLIQGTAVLGYPFAIMQGGWAALIANYIIAWISCYTGKLLVDCLYQVSRRGMKKRVYETFPELAEVVWPGYGFKIAGIVQVFEMYGCSILYIVALGTLFESLLGDLLPGLSVQMWCIIWACILLPFTIFVRRMSVIAWFSVASVFGIFFAIIVIIIYCIVEYERWSFTHIPGFNIGTFPVAFGIIVFSYSAHAVLPGVEASMNYPENYPQMLNWTFLISSVVKFSIGIMAVLVFDSSTQQMIIVNLEENSSFHLAATIFVIINVSLVFPLGMYVVCETWDSAMLPHFPHLGPTSGCHWVWLVLTRTILVVFGTFVGVSVPHFGLLMGVIGSLTGSCLCFIFPCYFHLKLKKKSLQWYSVVLDYVIIIFGVIAGSLGVFYSTKALVE